MKNRNKKEKSLLAQHQELREEIISRFKALMVEENDYIDVLLFKLSELLTEKEEYSIFAEDEILNEFGGDGFIDKYLLSGKVKDWIKVLQGIIILQKNKRKKIAWGLAHYIYDFTDSLESFFRGLAMCLSQGEISSDIQEKIIPLIQKFPWHVNDKPNLYLNNVICHGLIGSKKSLPFLRYIINESDIFIRFFEDDGFGEYYNDHFTHTRGMAIKALIKITDKNELSYLAKRFLIDILI